MKVENRGTVILHAAPNSDVEQKIFAFLARYLTHTSKENLASIVKKAPVTLGKNVSEKAGKVIVEKLKKLGATATYYPGHAPLRETRSTEDSLISPPNGSPRVETPTTDSNQQAMSDKRSRVRLKKPRIGQIVEVNKELWLILSMFILVGVMNYLLTSHRLVLGLYALPTLFSAYYYGRRHATLTAFASVFLVGLVLYQNPSLFMEQAESLFVDVRWYEITAWGGTLVITAYAMGTLCERNRAHMQELRSTYHGVLMVLRQFISQDRYTENHCYRVSIYAASIASNYGCSFQQIEDIRAAGLLHDIGKLEISRELLYKTIQFTEEEQEGMKRHVEIGANMLEPVGGSLARIIPIILSHHDRYDGSGYHSTEGQHIPLEARILSVADVYDALVSDRPYRKAMSPFEAKEVLVKESGRDFDPEVIKAFVKAFKKGEMEIPNVVI